MVVFALFIPMTLIGMQEIAVAQFQQFPELLDAYATCIELDAQNIIDVDGLNNYLTRTQPTEIIDESILERIKSQHPIIVQTIKNPAVGIAQALAACALVEQEVIPLLSKTHATLAELCLVIAHRLPTFFLAQWLTILRLPQLDPDRVILTALMLIIEDLHPDTITNASIMTNISCPLNKFDFEARAGEGVLSAAFSSNNRYATVLTSQRICSLDLLNGTTTCLEGVFNSGSTDGERVFFQSFSTLKVYQVAMQTYTTIENVFNWIETPLEIIFGPDKTTLLARLPTKIYRINLENKSLTCIAHGPTSAVLFYKIFVLIGFSNGTIVKRRLSSLLKKPADSIKKSSTRLIVFHETGKALACRESYTAIYDIDSTTRHLMRAPHKGKPCIACFNASGSLAAVGYLDGYVLVYDTTENKLIVSLKKLSSAVSTLAFSPTSNLLAASDKKDFILFDKDTNSIYSLHCPTDTFTWSHDGNCILLAFTNKSIQLWPIAKALQLLSLDNTPKVASKPLRAAVLKYLCNRPCGSIDEQEYEAQ